MKHSGAKSTPLLEQSDQMEELGQYSEPFTMKNQISMHLPLPCQIVHRP